jgi:ABC-2 type transport system ATP-binding protein
MIEIKNLFKAYKKFKLSVESLSIKQAESFGLVGNNGAGKTTLFYLMLDLLKAGSGSVELKNIDVSKSQDWKFFTASYLNEGFLIDFFTAREFFLFIARLYKKDIQYIENLVNSYKDFLPDDILTSRKFIRDYSQGNSVKIGIIAALIGEPKILILDEPFAHLDPRSQIQLKNILKTLNSEKQVTLLISSHDLNHITDVCKRICLLENGKIIKDLETNSTTLPELEKYFSV